jgi:cytochrome oxidase Cu insertion factor (SCO1/SenC/PrrC family)
VTGGVCAAFPYTELQGLRIRGQIVDYRKITVAVCTAIIMGFSPFLTASAGTANAESEQKAREYFTNLEVIDQDGQSLRFYDDVLKDKVVAINFIFTNCQGACPLMTRNMTVVRDMLGAELGEDIYFVSISIDPVRDTPAAMKEFAETHYADQEGWRFVTGDPENLEYIVKRLGQYTDNVEAHSTLLIAANVRTAHWTKIPPNVPPNGIVERLRMLIEEDATD